MNLRHLPLLFVCFLHAEQADPAAAGEPLSGLRRAVSVQGEYAPVSSPRESITGSLPGGWEEDSAWADVDVNYRPQNNNPYAGDRSLRVEVGNVRNGVVQFRVPNVAMAPSHIIRMRIPLRSEDNRSVTLTLRKRGAPYTAYWSTNLSARPEWGLFEVLVITRESDPDASLMFSMNTPGSLEVGDFEMEYLTPDQVLDGRSFEGNLLQSSSFPLGLSAPWAVGANGTTPEHLSADPMRPGPSGLPSLRMVPHRYGGRPMMQITSPFNGKSGAVHTFSFWAKSEKPGMSVSMRMGPPGARLWTDEWHKSITLTTEWTRYEHSVLLPPAPDMLYLARMTSHAEGTFWVDQVMVEVGESASDFQPAGAVELHAVADRDFGLSFENETLSYRLALTGDLSRATRIVGSVLDLYGKGSLLGAIPVADSGDFLILKAQLPPQDQFGTFLVTHQAIDSDGKPLGKPAELLLHRVRTPRHWGETAADSPFGTHVHITPASMRMAKALGFNWNRTMYSFNWSALQRPDGTWNFEGVDRNLELHRDNHLLTFTHLGGISEAQSVITQNWEGANSWWRLTAAPRMDAMDGFEEYAYQLLRHAGDSLKALEVWNEPFLPGFFVGDIQNGRPVRERPEVLMEMNRRARRAVERANYDGLLLWNAGPQYGESEKAFDTAVRDMGGAELVDGLTFHRYTNANLAFPGDRFQIDLGIIREVFDGKEALKHLWNSEGGHGLSEVFNLYQHVPSDLRARADTQAVQYVRYFLSNFAAGVEKVFIYTFFLQDGWVSSYGYMNVDGALSQIGPASSNMAWQLEGKRFKEMRALSDSVYGQLYEGESENTVVLLPSSRGTALLRFLPHGVSSADVYGNGPTLPFNFTSNLIYLRAPGLTLEQAAQILNAEQPDGLPVFEVPPQH